MADPAFTDAEPTDAVMADLILIDRPAVATHGGMRLCSASEAVPDLLVAPETGPFASDDGGRL